MEAFISELKAPKDALIEQLLTIYHRQAMDAFAELRFINPEIDKHDYYIHCIPAYDPNNRYFSQHDCGVYVRDYFKESGFFAKLAKDASFVFISWNVNLVERQKRAYVQRYINATKASHNKIEEEKDGEAEEEEEEEDDDEDDEEKTEEEEEEEEDEKEKNKKKAADEFEITAHTDRIELAKWLYVKQRG